MVLRRDHHVTHAAFLGQAGDEIGIELLGLELRRQLDVFSIGNLGAVLDLFGVTFDVLAVPDTARHRVKSPVHHQAEFQFAPRIAPLLLGGVATVLRCGND